MSSSSSSSSQQQHNHHVNDENARTAVGSVFQIWADSETPERDRQTWDMSKTKERIPCFMFRSVSVGNAYLTNSKTRRETQALFVTGYLTIGYLAEMAGGGWVSPEEVITACIFVETGNGKPSQFPVSPSVPSFFLSEVDGLPFALDSDMTQGLTKELLNLMSAPLERTETYSVILSGRQGSSAIMKGQNAQGNPTEFKVLNLDDYVS